MVPAVSRLPAAEAAEAQLAAADTLEPREEEELLDPSSIERLAILPANNKEKSSIFFRNNIKGGGGCATF